MNRSARITRRGFLGRSGIAALSATAILPAPAWGQRPRPAPSDRLALGFIGMGRISQNLLAKFLALPETQVVAVCDVDTTRREHARAAVDAKYGEGRPSGFKGCASFVDFRELLARDDIDAVVIATPDHWHAIQVIEACKVKKDIYCEKPLSLTIREAKLMIDAVRKHGRVLQTGSQQRTEFGGLFRTACSYVRSGRIGKVQAVHVGVGGSSAWCDLPEEPMEPGLDWDLWLGPAPKRPYNATLSPRGIYKHYPAWRKYREYSGGDYTDTGAHHFDIAQWGLGMDDSGPVEVIPPEDDRATKGLRYVYPNGVEMFHGGPFGVTFVGTEGLIHVNRQRLVSLPEKILKEPLGEGDVRLPEAPSHQEDWLRCIRSRGRPIADVEVGARSVTVCHLGNLSYWNRRRLRWDPQGWAFVGDREADSWLDRERRDPWQLPTA